MVIILKKIDSVLEALRCFISKWWRPLTCFAIFLSLLTHGVLLPLLRNTTTDLFGLAALVTAATAAFAVREWAKIRGTAE